MSFTRIIALFLTLAVSCAAHARQSKKPRPHYRTAEPFACAQETQTVLKPNESLTFSLAPEQEKLLVLQMKKGDFAEIQWLRDRVRDMYLDLSFEIYDSARKELLGKSREIETGSFSFVAPSDGDFVLVSKLGKSPEISSAQKISLQYNNTFKLPSGTKLKGIRKVNAFAVKIMTTPESSEGGNSVLLVEKNGQLLKAMKAGGSDYSGFYMGDISLALLQDTLAEARAGRKFAWDRAVPQMRDEGLGSSELTKRFERETAEGKRFAYGVAKAIKNDQD